MTIKKTLKIIEKELKITNLIAFLKNYPYPFATPFFAILNYSKMKETLIKDHPNWAFFCFFLSLIYVLFTIGFAIYLIVTKPKK